MTRAAAPSVFDHYQVLSLPSPAHSTRASTNEIKTAYRQALLQHHPDKRGAAAKSSFGKPTSGISYSIDQITLAYEILSSPKARAELDRALLLQPHLSGPGISKTHEHSHHTGLETVDLDDMSFEEGDNVWYRGCRCGDSRGYSVLESELEEAADQAEILTGCRGCSLWLRVVFQVVAEGHEADEGGRRPPWGP